MHKTLFSVQLPATQKTYDFWVPDDMCMQQAADLIAQAMSVAEPSFFRAKDANVLMYVPTGEIQRPDARVAEVGFTDGDRFVLL